jgi:hypothetical protein
VELEHLKIETTLIDEMFASVMGEYVFLKSRIGDPSMFQIVVVSDPTIRESDPTIRESDAAIRL